MEFQLEFSFYYGISNGILLKFYWNFIGILLDPAHSFYYGISNGILLEFYWNFIGILLEFYWIQHTLFIMEFQMDCWNFIGIPLKSLNPFPLIPPLKKSHFNGIVSISITVDAIGL